MAAYAAAMNQVLERDLDALMRRTRTRPLPDGRIHPGTASLFALLVGTLGLAELTLGANLLAATVALVTLVLKTAVDNGDIPESRVDEAVRRILRVKFVLGLFEHPMPDTKYQATVRSREHLELARQAVRESLVLLKNEGNILPLSKTTPVIFIAGEGANDIGLQSGGWTLGAALASKIRREQRVSVSFFGDGATGEGVLYESLNFASLKKLPLLFVCENNLYSTHLPILECRINDVIHEIGKPCSIATCRIDGNNVIEVYETAKDALDQCRKGEGPVFIEALTYRLRGHVGPDDNIQGTHTDIPPAEEVMEWTRRDPIQQFERHLLTSGLITPSEIEVMISEIDSEIRDAYQFTQNSEFPQPHELKNYVYK